MSQDNVKKANRRFVLSVVALVVAIIVTVTVCLAWFYFNLTTSTDPLEVVVVSRAFAMGYIRVDSDSSFTDTNEFTGLLPGSYFNFSMEIKRKIAGDLYFRVDYIGIKGEEFVGKNDGLKHSMTELFCTTTLDESGAYTAPPRFFSKAEEGKLNLVRSVHLPPEVESVVVYFMIQFSNDQVPMSELTPAISKKVFDIGNIFINADGATGEWG